MKNVLRKSTFMLAIALTLQVVMGSFFMQIAFASPPVLTTSPGSASFVAGDNTTSTPVVIDSGITVTDGSSTTLASATVAIQNGFHGGEDFLGFTNDGATMGNISASYNAATGEMILTSAGATATLAQWQSALRSITYTDTAIMPNTATRTISFTAINGTGTTSDMVTRTVTVTATYQTPKVKTTGGTTAYTIGTSAVIIDSNVTVSDRDSTTMSSALVSIGTGFHSGDTLTFVNTNSTTYGNIVGSYNAVNGVLTLTSSGATATLLQWSHALSAVWFSTAASSMPGIRTISFIVNDGTKTSAAATDEVNVIGPAVPVVTHPANGSATNDTTPVISGTAEPNHTVTIVLDGTAAGTTVASSMGSWSWTPAVALAEGPHTVKVKSLDGTGNTSPDSNTNTFTVDTTPPPAPVILRPANGYITNDATPMIGGTAEPGLTVTIVLDGTAAGSTVATATGTWSWKPASALAEGTHTVKAAAMDIAGNTSPDSNTNTCTVDTTPPAAPVVVTPSNGSTMNVITPTISGTAEAGTTVTIVLDGAAAGTTTAVANGSWSWTPASALAEGPHTVKATVTDTVGNTSPDSNTNTFTIDTAPPLAPVITVPVNGSTMNSPTLAISGMAEAGAAVTIVTDGAAAGTTTAAADGSWSWTPASALAEGPHTVKATAMDIAGNTSPESNTVTFTIDTTPSAAPIVVTPANGFKTNNAMPDISGTAEADAAVTVVLDGAAAGTTTAAANGSWSWTPASALAEGPHTVKAMATDTVGNTSPDSNTIMFTIDTMAPVITLLGSNAISITEGEPFVDPGATAVDNMDGDLSAHITVTGTVYNQIPETYTLRYNVRDIAGNAALEAIRTVRVNPRIHTSGDDSGGDSSSGYYSGNADLKQLIVTANGIELPLSPAFAAGTAEYTIETTANQIEVRPIPSDAFASVAVQGEAAIGAKTVSLHEGDNQIEISVKAENGTIKTYALIVRRPPSAIHDTPSCLFSDIQGHWGESQICEAAANGIVEGDTPNVFRPNGLVSRVEFAAMLLRALGVSSGTEANELPFTDRADVPDWAKGTVGTAVERGILNGYSDGTLRPRQTISRSEAAAIVARAMKWEPMDSATTFTDDADIPVWAKGYVQSAARYGVLVGREGNRFAPDEQVTRAEAAVALLRLRHRLK
ncbi:Ig-like domain-containing protein [Paenibacillus sp. OAS669]|uniref:Ig-like domain-containing protein n=1 Tax=Paenibacillus sp. OAS669 TaxID=2663821 RepID=UPI00178A87B8|nr:Ig-like domain-containing protein [Paenibacillus sp. OAS669]MBE1443035.1 hypothetical protein [Paenibacillus sp. OAS669]